MLHLGADNDVHIRARYREHGFHKALNRSRTMQVNSVGGFVLQRQARFDAFIASTWAINGKIELQSGYNLRPECRSSTGCRSLALGVHPQFLQIHAVKDIVVNGQASCSDVFDVLQLVRERNGQVAGKAAAHAFARFDGIC